MNKKELKSLLEDTCAKAPSEPLSKVLPIALNLSLKLKNEAFEKWVRLELNGYTKENQALKETDVVPEYRTVVGQYIDIYRRPLIIDNPDLFYINEQRLRNSIVEIENLFEKHQFVTMAIPHTSSILREHFNVDVNYFQFSPVVLSPVISSIRTKLIDWLNSIEAEQYSESQDSASMGNDETLSYLHQGVIKNAKELFNNGHYRNAVLDTCIALNASVQKKSKRSDLDGVKLMQTVFSPTNPILRVSEDKDEQQGCMWLFSGCAMAIRNPKAHNLIPDTQQVAKEWLSFLSSLFRILDNSKKTRFKIL